MVALTRFFSFIIVFGIIVLVHEFGHFIAARLMKIRVEVFSFGFGKRLFGKKWGTTDFRVSLVPIGGYVRLAGEEDFDPRAPRPDDLYAKNRGQRFLTFFMGSVMNLLLAVFIITIINMTGVETESYKIEKPVIGFVEADSPALKAGLQAGDLLQAMNGRVVSTWKDAELQVATHPNESMDVEYERLGKKQKTRLAVSSLQDLELGFAGFFWQPETEGKDPAGDSSLKPPQVGLVIEQSRAGKAGLRRGDLIISVNGREVSTRKEVESELGASPKGKVVLEYSRAGEKFRAALGMGAANVAEIGYAGFYARQKAEIGGLIADLPAQQAGLELNDIVLALDDIPIDDYWRLRELIRQSPEKNLSLTIRRSSETKKISVLPIRNDRGEGVIGFNPKYAMTMMRYGFFSAIGKSVAESVRLVGLTFDAFKRMAQRKLSPKNLSGPLEIARYSQQALSSGLSNFFMLIAFISLQLGIVNLFPVPGLDGGHLMILGIESVIRRDLNQKLKTTLIYIGFILLLALMTFVILNDIAKSLPNGWKSIFPF